MSRRSDIIDGSDRCITRDITYGLVFTDNLGWIDLGHANPGGAEHLWSQMTAYHSGNDGYFEVNYFQRMSKNIAGIRTSTGIYKKFHVRGGLSEPLLKSVALSIFLSTSVQFEALQNHWPYIIITDSGYSVEDLVSDLLGFYQAVDYADYTPFLHICSKEKAYRIWDYYGPVGQFKNKNILPLLFPDPLDKSIKHQPYFGHLPAFMCTVSPVADPNIVREIFI